ncbi:hypothetical protein HKBW3S44_01256 [Candidatus Hakubella thermalkaliphila]|uniref:Integration host factor-like helix-two turn-helix domain-containing protein n=1 Tax=Candidatus Hakubella thermalkaliphila TaxID=2754717 RepID=A0A6V8PYL4_9ACTN|nr:integration host factor, actinobacterial type [Candidatus Hakubella thermalkaliphila]GFP30067.1 hypothetical protein HKBW3S34_00987 [Candidatus Hakubella thermalkaliphila]GFP37578.1 hypothetical protein HKBW3S44_01256 [Candidatus Hakubella thermalkaliphila]GFP39839.1 hypothetical protein HKBW3S47_01536 [Candidatus Hakubella thermalkaliphila]
MKAPQLSAEQRKMGICKAVRLRRERAAIKQKLRRGKLSLEQVISMDNEAVSKIKVIEILESLPKIGKLSARHIMEELEISPDRRIRGLGSRQREALLDYLDTRTRRSSSKKKRMKHGR